MISRIGAAKDAWKNSIQELVKLAPVAEKNRVKIGVENVWNNFLLSPVEMAYYLDQVPTHEINMNPALTQNPGYEELFGK